MKKVMKTSIASIMVLSCLCSLKYTPSHAEEFAGHEDEYTQMCSDSSSLSRAQLKTCQDFSAYLKNKNNTISQNISATQDRLNATLADAAEAQKELDQTTAMIESVAAEIAVLRGQIADLTQRIDTKNQLIRDRMYIMQTYINGNELTNLLLSSGSLDQFIARIQCIDELTNYDKELIIQIAKERVELEDAEALLVVRQDELFVLSNQQRALIVSLEDQAYAYSSEISQQSAILKHWEQELGPIDVAIGSAEMRLKAEEEAKRAEEEAKRQQQLQQGQSSSPSLPNLNVSVSGSEIGQGVANLALSKVGCDYVFATAGPNTFDCSGLVKWCYAQYGIYLPHGSRPQYAMATLVDTPEPGDAIFFNTYAWLGHVGIYVGNGKVVHASTEGVGVIISDLNSTYYRNAYAGAGRFY